MKSGKYTGTDKLIPAQVLRILKTVPVIHCYWQESMMKILLMRLHNAVNTHVFGFPQCNCHSFPSSAEVKNGGLYLDFPILLHCVML
jgi:hypothetical protein